MRKKKKHLSFVDLLKKHSLSLVLALLTIFFKGGAAILPDGYWRDFFQGFGDDTWGAFVVIVATKYFIEIGSPQSSSSKGKAGS